MNTSDFKKLGFEDLTIEETRKYSGGGFFDAIEEAIQTIVALGAAVGEAIRSSAS